MSEDYRPRFAFEISEEQQNRASRLFIIHGQRKELMSIILDDLLDLIEEHGQVITGLILSRTVRPRDVIPSLAQANSKANSLK